MFKYPRTDFEDVSVTASRVRWHLMLSIGSAMGRFPPLSRLGAPSGRTSGLKRQQRSARQEQIGQPKQREQLHFVLRQPAIARLPVLEQVLDHMERVLDLCPNARLGVLELFEQRPQPVGRQRFALAALHGDVPSHRGVPILFALGYALVACITEHLRLLAVQQLVRLAHIAYVGRRRHDRMHQPGLGIDADVRLHPEVPLVALLRLVHLGVARLGAVLGRRGRGNERRINDRALAHHQASLGQMRLDDLEDFLREPVRLEQATKPQQRGRVGRRLAGQIDANESADCLAVVDGVLDPFIGQAEALLSDIHPQHPSRPDRRTAATATLRIERFDLCLQRRPRRHRFDLGQEAVAPRLLLLPGVLQLGKARLHRLRSHRSSAATIISKACRQTRSGGRINQRFLSVGFWPTAAKSSVMT